MATSAHARLLPPLLPLLLLLLLVPPPALAATTHPSPGLPLVVNTWGGPFTAATDAAYLVLANSSTHAATAVDAVEAGCAACERNRCDGTVGFGGSPDERCETTLDALVMDGTTMKVGAVAGLRRVRDAVAVARAVLERTAHSMLAGDLATEFAVQNGFAEEDLTTGASAAQCRAWRRDRCQPNYRLAVRPDPRSSCGPYEPSLSSPSLARSGGGSGSSSSSSGSITRASHDTIALLALHPSGRHAAGTSTNGAAHKVPGRVGDGPIAGSGAYVDSDVGACGATGDGDVMMRFLPCYQAVESMRRRMSPADAAEDAVRRMLRRYPDLRAGIVVADRDGRHGAAASGWTFTYSFRGGDMARTQVVTVEPLNAAVSEL